MLARRPAVFSRLPGRPQRRVAIRHRVAALRRQGRSAAGTAPATARLLSRLPRRFHRSSTATLSWSTTTRTSTSASCRRWAPTASAASMSARRIFCRAFLTRSRTCAGWRQTSSCPSHCPRCLTLSKQFRHRKNCRTSHPRRRVSPSASSASPFTIAMPTDRLRQRRRICLRCPQPAQSGREEQFRALTGKDAAVIDYLDRQESVHQFLSHVILARGCERRQLPARGFSNLMVSFGCTGGQHRSVYLAEQLAQHLRATEAWK